MVKKRCPKCGHNRFGVNAHVVQSWEVDEYGNFIACIDDCSETTHEADDSDEWCCLNCGYKDMGSKFNVNE